MDFLKTVAWGMLVAGTVITPTPAHIALVIAFAPDGLKGAAGVAEAAGEKIEELKKKK